MIIAIVIAIIIILFILSFYFIGNNFYNIALNPKVSKAFVLTNMFPKSSKEQREKIKKENFEWLEKHSENIYINSYDDLKLQAYKVENKKPSKDWVIIIHGYNASADEMVPVAIEFFEKNFNILLVNLRGHGLSQGTYIGMGWHDRLDIIKWIETIIKEDKNSNIILFGESMGAATVMMTIGEEIPKNVKAAIEDCGYTNVIDEFKHILVKGIQIPPITIMAATNAITKIKAKYSLYKASSVEQIKKAKTPTLFIHGSADDFVPYKMLDELYENASCVKEKLVIDGAGHGQSRYEDHDLYWKTVFNFIEKNKNGILN